MPITVQGEIPLYTVSGKGTITNAPQFLAPRNIAQTALDLQNAGIKSARVSTIIPTTGNTYAISSNIDTFFVNNATTTAALTLVFPTIPAAGQNIRFEFNSAVTNLTLSAPTGYTVGGTAITTAAAGAHFTYELIGTVWMPS